MGDVRELTVERPPAPRPGPLAFVLLLPIHAYRKTIGRLLPPSCRFYPTCSTYAVEALRRHGAFGGLYLTVRRLLRCNPWHLGGIDEVPLRFRWQGPTDFTGPADLDQPDRSTQE